MYLEGLPLFAAGHGAASLRLEGGAGFWPALEQLVDGDGVAGQLDDLLAGATSPRTWLVLHEPGEPQLSCVAALMLARALTGRGQNVLVLDVDEDEAALTRWTGREETEGWIDVARFGASVLGAGITLPFPGGRGTLLGTGSFRPTDATDGEIVSLVGRLRHQGDDIVLVGSVGPAVVPWARLATRRILCWDPTVRAADQLQNVNRPFEASGVPLTGVLAFGDVPAAPVAMAPVVADEVVAVDAVVADVAAAASADEPAPTGIPADAVDGSEDGIDDGSDEGFDGEVDDDVAAVPGVPEDDEALTAPTLAVTAGVDVPAPRAEVDPEERAKARAAWQPRSPSVSHDADLGLGLENEVSRGTPRVFWLATGVFVVALLAVAWYWSEYVRVPPGGYFSPVATREDSTSARRDSTALAAGAQPATGAAGDDARQVAEAGSLTSIDDSLSEARRANGPGGAKPAPANAAAVPDVMPAVPAGHVASPAQPAAAPAIAPLDRNTYEVPVGQAGWALHVYSVPDSAGAVKECLGLKRAGFQSAVRIVEIKEKGGRWWRIYVGSYPSKSAALAAMPALLEKLSAKWAEPSLMK